MTDHQKRRAVWGVDWPLFAKTGFLVRLDGAPVGGTGIGQDLRYACCEQAVSKGANKTGAMAALDHIFFADELIDAARASWQRAETMIGPGARIVALQIGKGPAVAFDNELIDGWMSQVFAYQRELLHRIAPPFDNMRRRKPSPDGRQIVSRHRPKRIRL